MNGQSIGPFAIGDQLDFCWASRTEGGATITFDPEYYDVIDCSDGDRMFVDQQMSWVSGDGTTSTTYPPTPTTWYDANLFVPDDKIQITVANGFAPGGSYAVILKNQSSGAPDSTDDPTEWQLMNFTVGYGQLGSPSVDGATAAADPNTLLGRLETIERNQVNVIFPRLMRALGLLGENQIADGFVYDDAGNITSLRVRIFDTRANATIASTWNDTENQTDPAPSLQSGEITRYIMLASHLNPRQLRSLLDQRTNSGDEPSDEGQVLSEL